MSVQREQRAAAPFGQQHTSLRLLHEAISMPGHDELVPTAERGKKNHPQAGWISDRVVQHTPQAL